MIALAIVIVGVFDGDLDGRKAYRRRNGRASIYFSVHASDGGQIMVRGRNMMKLRFLKGLKAL
jgi:hypothetical protein